jgi:hypothetical protein
VGSCRSGPRRSRRRRSADERSSRMAERPE